MEIRRRNTPYRINLIGQRYGNLVVIGDAQPRLLKNGAKERVLECRCDCDKTALVLFGNLRTGHTISCGCMMTRRGTRSEWYKHGGSKTATYRVWNKMKRRCSDPGIDAYPFYGGRGIIVCPAWSRSFELFLSDMGERPARMELDRINPDGPYCPFNCRWASHEQQMNNMRSNIFLTFQGERLTLAQWSRKLGIPYSRLISRVRAHWPTEHVLTLPPQRTGGRTPHEKREVIRDNL